MATKKTIANCLLKIKIDHSIQISDSDFHAKVGILADDCQSLTDGQFTFASEKLRKTDDLYGKFPKAGAFLEKAGLKSFTPDKEASIEADRIINQAEYHYGNDTLFDNPYTNAAVKSYGGLGKVKYQLFDSYNTNSRNWVHRELKEIWLDCYDGKKKDVTACIGNSSVKAGGVYVGDKEKCLALGNNLKEIENGS